jgi:hypothetical protein
VYRGISEAMDAVKADVAVSVPERIAAILMRLPRPSSLAVGVLVPSGVLDWLPGPGWGQAPFHGSLTLLDMGSLGSSGRGGDPDFGNLPSASPSAQRKCARATDPFGAERHYGTTHVCDGRIATAIFDTPSNA